MKIKLAFTAIGFLLSYVAFCQDSVSRPLNKVTFKNESRSSGTQKSNSPGSPGKQNHIYRDTRLGSSAPMYNTYKKNDYGAGAVTTDPDKGENGSPAFTPARTDSIK